ncbi:DUF397 domain-containing protein [Streptomyces sp. A0642]|uniref:DUF397 domain-containing protein n=1 Tax=Streptomyces sp. A0642 TaxID=2563100 RepID=UPI0010A2523C|nr:DUF397 domain-containing protein [Streptomyces sp. A0642]THA72488.1 DUF397 domain-containing protein [Streptomyces sp. A0642]
MTKTLINKHKSSYSGGAGENCLVQGLEATTNEVGVEDSKQGAASPILTFSPSAWTAFVADVSSTKS